MFSRHLSVRKKSMISGVTVGPARKAMTTVVETPQGAADPRGDRGAILRRGDPVERLMEPVLGW